MVREILTAVDADVFPIAGFCPIREYMKELCMQQSGVLRWVFVEGSEGRFTSPFKFLRTSLQCQAPTQLQGLRLCR